MPGSLVGDLMSTDCEEPRVAKGFTRQASTGAVGGRAGFRPCRALIMTLVWVALSGLGLVGIVGHGPAVWAEGGDGDGVVLVTRVDGPITPVIADHLHEVVARGERDGHEAVVIELDTPGGRSTSGG